MADQPSITAGVFHQPFTEQLAFFRQKLGNLVPTARWDDLKKAQHDVGFMIAGAQKADFLASMAASIDKAQAGKLTLDEFRKDFAASVKKHDWHGWVGEGTKGGEAWRTRIIYTTNTNTAYAAGRYAQLKEGGFDLWVYQHADGVAHPRPIHQSWSGLTLPADDAFWDGHYPPNGWHCHCFVTGARSQSDAERQGGNPAKQLPSDWDHADPKTGEAPGIDKGWGYAPGASAANTVREMAQKTQNWPYTLAKSYMQGVPATQRDALAKAYRDLPSTADDARRYARRVLGDTTAIIPPYQTLGLATQTDIQQISKLKDLDVDGYDFALDASAVKHIQSHHGEGGSELLRGQLPVQASSYAQLPELLNGDASWEEAGVAKKTSHPLVKKSLDHADGRYTAVFEVRKKRKMLVLQSYYIGKPKAE